jgi:hypothetical protein
VRAALAFLLLCGILLAFIAGWVPWSEAPGFVPWFLVGVLGYTMTFMAPTNRFVLLARQALLIALVAMMVGACYHAGWVKVPTFTGLGCQSSLGFTLRFDRSQCLAVTKVGGDGVNNLPFEFAPQKGTNFVNRGEGEIFRKKGFCSGVLRATHETSALDWTYQLVPTKCDRIDDFVILAAAAEAPDPKWIGNEITVTLSRKE